jgi:hypothetical protein
MALERISLTDDRLTVPVCVVLQHNRHADISVQHRAHVLLAVL